MITGIIIAAALVGGVGLFIGLFLGVAGKKFAVEVDEREEAIPMISALKPEGAFYLFVDVSGTYGKSYEGTEIHSAADFAAILIAEKYVAVVPCADFGMPDYIRLSYATDMEQIKKGMDRIEEMVKALA